MADSEERKSVEAEYESDDDEVSALWWTSRRREASDDDDDDGDGDCEEIFDRRWSSVVLDDESYGVDEASEYDVEREGGVIREELDEVSQEEEEEEGDEGEVQEMVHVNKEKEKKAVNEEVLFVPRSGWFYMHDDRFRTRRYGRRRGTVLAMKLWDCADEQKWKHDKFEDITDKNALKSHCQQQRKNPSKGHRYADTNQFGSVDNLGNQNNKTSRIVKGRGPVKYKPIVKSNNLNPSYNSKHQIWARLRESTSSYGCSGLSSSALAISSDSRVPRMQQLISTMDSSLPVSNSITSCHDMNVFVTQRSTEQYGRSNKYIPTSTQQDDKQPVSVPNVLQRKPVSNFSESNELNIEDSTLLVDDKHFTYQTILFPMPVESLQMGGKMEGYSFPTQQIYQPYSTEKNDNKIPLPQLNPVIEQTPITSTNQTSSPLCSQQSTLDAGNEYQTLSKSLAANLSIETLPQTSNIGHDLVGSGSAVLQGDVRGSFQLGGSPSRLPVIHPWGLPYGAVDDAPSMAIGGYAPESQLGSRNCGMISMREGAGAAKPCNINKPLADTSELVEHEFRQRRLKPQRYSKMRMR